MNTLYTQDKPTSSYLRAGKSVKRIKGILQV